MFSTLKPRVMPIVERRLAGKHLAWKQIEGIGARRSLSTWGLQFVGDFIRRAREAERKKYKPIVQ